MGDEKEPDAVRSTPFAHHPIACLARRRGKSARGFGASPFQDDVIEPEVSRPAGDRSCFIDGFGPEAMIDGKGRQFWTIIACASPSMCKPHESDESDPPETATATCSCRAAGSKSVLISSSEKGRGCCSATRTLQLRLRPLARFRRLGELIVKLGIGRAGLLLLTQPIERQAKLQEAVGCFPAFWEVAIAGEEGLSRLFRAIWWRRCKCLTPWFEEYKENYFYLFRRNSIWHTDILAH